MGRIVVNALTLRQGGGLQVVGGLLARLSDRHSYTVLCADPTSRDLFSEIVGDRAHIGYDDPVGSPSAARAFMWSMTQQASYLRDNDAACVFGINHHFPSGDATQIVYHLNVLRFERENKPVWAAGEFGDRLRDWRAAKALTEADSNLFESRFIHDLAKRNRGAVRNGEVLYIGLRDPIPKPPANLPRSPTPQIVAVTSGAAHKDNATLVRMLARLRQLRPDVGWTLKVAGNPNEALVASMMPLASELGVSDAIELLGFCDHKDLLAVGRESLCLATTSLAESFCMVALEAMSWGCPAVVADISSMPESIGDAGLLARPSDPDDFATQVLRLWDNPDLLGALVTKGLERASGMTWSAAAARLEDVIAGLTGPGGA